MQHAIESVEKARNFISNGATISFDGAWDHNRRGHFNIVSFNDSKQNKIVDFAIMHRGVTYFGSSQGMEVAALSVLVDRWKNDMRVTHFCHDKDSKGRDVILEKGWDIQELLDKGHSVKGFDKLFSAYNIICKRKLNGLKTLLHNWLVILIHDSSKTVCLWQISYYHFTGDHTNCIDPKHKASFRFTHTEDTLADKCFKDLLNDSQYIIEKCVGQITTNPNESYNAARAKKSNKSINWKSSWPGRAAVAILDFNESRTWVLNLRQELNVPPLDPSLVAKLEKDAAKRDIIRYQSKTEEYRRKRNAKRKERRLRESNSKYDTSYNMNKNVDQNSICRMQESRNWIPNTLFESLTAKIGWPSEILKISTCFLDIDRFKLLGTLPDSLFKQYLVEFLDKSEFSVDIFFIFAIRTAFFDIFLQKGFPTLYRSMFSNNPEN